MMKTLKENLIDALIDGIINIETYFFIIQEYQKQLLLNIFKN